MNEVARTPRMTPAQVRRRDRVESVIGLMAPGLDLVLGIGDRISRLVEPEDYGYYPVRPRDAEGEGRGALGPSEPDASSVDPSSADSSSSGTPGE